MASLLKFKIFVQNLFVHTPIAWYSKCIMRLALALGVVILGLGLFAFPGLAQGPGYQDMVDLVNQIFESNKHLLGPDDPLLQPDGQLLDFDLAQLSAIADQLTDVGINWLKPICCLGRRNRSRVGKWRFRLISILIIWSVPLFRGLRMGW